MEPQEAAEVNGDEGVVHIPAPIAVKNPSVMKKASWKTKCMILKDKCDQIDQSNDVLYAKSRQIYKMIQRAESEKKVLMRRLEQYEVEVGERHTTNSVITSLKMTDSFTPPPSFPRSAFTSPTPDPSETDFVQTLRQDIATVPSPSANPQPPTSSLPTHTTTHHNLPPPAKKSRLSTPTTTAATPTAAAAKPTKRTPKSSAKSSPASRRKKNSDTGAPKKPSNAFFWFCQEQRGSLEEQFRGEGVAGQHSLTKILAQKWGETATDDREKYYLKYTEDKKRYEREMQAYHQKRQQQQQMLEKQLQQQLPISNPLPSTK